MSTAIGIRPNAKFQTAAKLEATGRTSFGNWTWRIRPPGPRHRRDPVVDRGLEPLPGQDRGEDEDRVIRLLALEDDRDEHDVDRHLEERIDDPPEVAEERVGALLADVGLDEVADQAASIPDLEGRPREGVPAVRAGAAAARYRAGASAVTLIGPAGYHGRSDHSFGAIGVRCQALMTPTDQRAAATAPRPVAMVTHSYYEEDPRVRREAEALVAAGRQVDVFALRRPDDPVRRGHRRRTRPPAGRPASPGRRSPDLPRRVPRLPGPGRRSR